MAKKNNLELKTNMMEFAATSRDIRETNREEKKSERISIAITKSLKDDIQAICAIHSFRGNKTNISELITQLLESYRDEHKDLLDQYR